MKEILIDTHVEGYSPLRPQLWVTQRRERSLIEGAAQPLEDRRRAVPVPGMRAQLCAAGGHEVRHREIARFRLRWRLEREPEISRNAARKLGRAHGEVLQPPGE